jgi:DNA processing protein
MPRDTGASADPTLSEPERIARLRLARTENVGPVTFRHLIDRFGSAAAAIDALPDLARRGGRRRPLRVPTLSAVDREIEANDRIGARIVVFGEDTYPTALAAIDDAPAAFSLLGAPSLLGRQSLAVVGARNASMNGRRLAASLAGAVGRSGYAIVSGLARGIDAAGHDGALETGTIAVVAGGIDVIYPPQHDDLYRRISEAGAIVAEQPVGTTPQARHFPSRNRIIAGLALGVLVVEAAARSGSLITARRALDQGREVFAVPGSPLDPRCAGTNGLIKEGAAFLVESAADILLVLSSIHRVNFHAPEQRDRKPAFGFEDHGLASLETGSDARSAVLAGLGPEPVPVDELIRGCQLSAPIVATVLLEAELAGLVDRHPGNQVSRRMDVPS